MTNVSAHTHTYQVAWDTSHDIRVQTTALHTHKKARGVCTVVDYVLSEPVSEGPNIVIIVFYLERNTHRRHLSKQPTTLQPAASTPSWSQTRSGEPQHGLPSSLGHTHTYSYSLEARRSTGDTGAWQVPVGRRGRSGRGQLGGTLPVPRLGPV